jgi:hypothetical protein
MPNILEIPTRNDLPSYSYVISLDGVNFTLAYTFNDRMQKWFLNLADASGNQIVSQVPVIASMPLFDRFVAEAVPAGTLFAFDTSGQNMDPGRFDLGDRVRMLYAEKGAIV